MPTPVLSIRRKIPIEGGGYLLLPEQVVVLRLRNRPRRLTRREIVETVTIGRRGDDAGSQCAIAARELVEHEAKIPAGRHLAEA